VSALLSVGGVLLAAFVPTFLKHVRLSKISEATEQLDAMHRGAAAYYAQNQQLAGHMVHGCLPQDAGPFPETPSQEPTLVDFSADEAGRDTWKALGLNATLPLRYVYSVKVAVPGCAPRDVQRGSEVVTLRAEGDLDGDGVKSLLERGATISADQAELVPIPPLRVTNRIE
jgi:hypothetical protein